MQHQQNDFSRASPTPRRAWYVVGIVVILVMLSYIDRAVLSLFAQPVQATFGISDSRLGLLFGLGFIAPLSLATLAVGWAVDRFDRIPIIAGGVLVWSLASGFSGLAGSFGALLLARGMMGLGEATIGPAGYALVAATFPAESRGRAMGAIAAAVSVGTGLALIVGGLLLKVLGTSSRTLPLIGTCAPWQLAYLLLGLTGIPAAILALTMRDPRQGKTVNHAQSDWSFLRGAPTLFLGLCGCAMLNVAVGTGIVAWAPTLLVRRFDLAPSEAGYLLGAVSILGGLTGPLLAATLSDGWLRSDKPRGRMHGHVALFSLMAIGVTMLVTAPAPFASAVGLICVTFTLGALNAVSYASVPDITPGAMTGRMLAALQFLSLAVGYGSGPSLVAAFTDHVFHDKAMLGPAILSACLPLCLAGMVLARMTGHNYSRFRVTT